MRNRLLALHEENPDGLLQDPLDAFNLYIAAKLYGDIVGFISVTPPGRTYAVEKFIDRGDLPFPIDDGLYEIRLMTVVRAYRGRPIAPLLMVAALRWVEAQGGRRIVAIGHKEALSLYFRTGLVALERRIRKGVVTFELMTAEVEALRRDLDHRPRLLARLERGADWRLDVPFRPAALGVHPGSLPAAGSELGHQTYEPA